MIRPATLDDLPSHDGAGKACCHRRPLVRRAISSYFLRYPGPASPWCSRNNDAIQGFLIVRGVASEWEIENIAIAATSRRRGLGTRLLREFLKTARSRGATAVYLDVRESNTSARRLYEKCAFSENGRRPNYYRDPEEAAILFRLDLS